jgi:acetyl esterase/lipase
MTLAIRTGLLVMVCVLVACGSPHVQAPAPMPAPVEVPLWPGAVPDAQPLDGPENAHATNASRDDYVAGRPWTHVMNVAHPTVTIYPPRGRNTGVAVVVAPGGGYKILAIDLEGTEACDWLTSVGITCVLLKYRVPRGGPYWSDECKCHVMPKAPLALEDAQRAISLVRARAAEWYVDPHKIGILGFSAGGHVVAGASTHFTERAYAAVDAADRESCRPDFAVALYPGHLWVDEEKFELAPDIARYVTRDASPTLLVHAENDDVDDVKHSLVYYLALKQAGAPVELHLYAQGGHAFGLRPTRFPITAWPRLVEAWLHALGMLAD